MMRNKKVVFLACNANKSVAKRMPNFTKRGEELGSGRKRYRRIAHSERLEDPSLNERFIILPSG